MTIQWYPAEDSCATGLWRRLPAVRRQYAAVNLTANGDTMRTILWLAGGISGAMGMLTLVKYGFDQPGGEVSSSYSTMGFDALPYLTLPGAGYVGLIMLAVGGTALCSQPWMIIKLVSVVFMSIAHGKMAKWRKDFEADHNLRSQKFYRIANEVPTVLMIVIVFVVIVQPF